LGFRSIALVIVLLLANPTTHVPQAAQLPAILASETAAANVCLASVDTPYQGINASIIVH